MKLTDKQIERTANRMYTEVRWKCVKLSWFNKSIPWKEATENIKEQWRLVACWHLEQLEQQLNVHTETMMDNMRKIRRQVDVEKKAKKK